MEDDSKSLKIKDHLNLCYGFLNDIENAPRATIADAMYQLAMIHVYLECKGPMLDFETRTILAIYQITKTLENPLKNITQMIMAADGMSSDSENDSIGTVQ